MQNTNPGTDRGSAQHLESLQIWNRLRLISKRKMSVILIFVGAILLAYVGSEYASMYNEQRSLHQQWAEQQSSAVGSAPEPVSSHDGLTRVSIPKIDLDVIVVEGTSHKALRLGPGHLKGTPVPGETGNSVISAHRDTFFRNIYELQNGDEIKVRRDGHTYTFQVTGKKIVPPNDLSVIKKTSETRLTLITCYPIYYVGPAPKRLVVFSKLVDTAKTSPERAHRHS